ncbi:hypothetical protein EVAR_95164_1 [Eumeta japonica]|uniref:Uncharacterized protein n=1 Tax=Eumeta variegata TaxID=151549 RepID=A0A4C1VHI9_EUMVA|nr:hypothetical protein EVAR_95164_1 [Eumeta japonica]
MLMATIESHSSSALSSTVDDSDDNSDKTAIGNGEQLKVPSFQYIDDDSGTTVTRNGIKEELVKLTAEEKQRYATMTIEINGEKLNALFVLQNKIRDLNMCEKYKKYEGRSFGRGFTKRS